MASTRAPILTLEHVHKSFGAVPVLHGVSFEVQRGQVTCIIGPSGSGKSTILRCINGLVEFDGGKIFVDGLNVAAGSIDKKALRRKVGMVFQQYNLFPHMTVLENVVMAPVAVLKETRGSATERARALLRKVQLEGKEGAYPGQLSGGQQQRVAIARSLAMKPEIMLFDEVTAALDPEMVKEVLVTIRELAKDGMTCILVTHEMRFAREVADLVCFTDRGVIVERGTPQKMFDKPQDPRTVEFLSKVL